MRETPHTPEHPERERLSLTLVRHGLAIPGLAIPGLAIPGLTIPGLTIPGLTIPGLTIPGRKADAVYSLWVPFSWWC